MELPDQLRIIAEELEKQKPLEPPADYLTREYEWRYGVVAMLDALGIGRLGKQSTERFLGLAEMFEAMLRDAGPSHNTLAPKLGLPTSRHNVTAFGDTFLATWEVDPSAADSLEAKLYVIESMAQLIAAAHVWALTNDLVLRGALTIGWFVIDEPRFVGPAITEAARWYELPKLISIVAAPSIGSLLDTEQDEHPECFKYGSFRQSWVKCSTDCHKAGEVELWHVDWPLPILLNEPLYRNLYAMSVEDFVDRVLSRYTPPKEAQGKYVLTKRFVLDTIDMHRRIARENPAILRSRLTAGLASLQNELVLRAQYPESKRADEHFLNVDASWLNDTE